MFQTIADTPLVAFDVETTGFEAFGDDRIVEIAAVKVIGGEVTTETFESFVNPERNIPIAVSKIHGITDDMVEDAPTMEEVWVKFKEFVGDDAILIAHNAEFDMNFIKAHCARHNIDISHIPESVCTLKLARRLYPDLNRHRLMDVTEHLQIERDETKLHRALYDTEILAHALVRMIKDGNYQMVMDMM